MSCSTLSAQPIRLTVTVGNLPEGYCPANFQQFATDFAARLIVTPNQNNSTFVTGSIEPTSNVGPWLKDCLEWFVFEDSTGRYRPETIGVFKNMVYYTSNDTFTVPDNIFKIKAHAWGAGGGGSAQVAGVAGSGGGGGGFGIQIFDVTPNQNISLIVGAGGAAGANGGNTTILTLVANGGTGATNAAGTSTSGVGGATTGAVFPVSGGTGGSAFQTNTAVGFGGASPQGGSGGTPSDVAAKVNGVVPGGGGGGQFTGSTPAGITGSGASGGILIEY